MLTALRPILERVIIDDAASAAGSDRFFDSLWAGDSTTFRNVLARMVVDESSFGLVTATNAAALYHHYSGSPLPILQLAQEGGSDRRLHVLSAIGGRISPEQQETVFRFACDAAREFEAFRRDTAFARQYSRNRLALRWPGVAAATLLSARRLLTGSRRPSIDYLIRSLRADRF